MALAVASVSASLLYPINFPLRRRQEPGTPEYDCHANCGTVIVDGRTEGYCDTANFTSALQACLDCALEFDIWQYYGHSVAQAATACGLDATPVPANATSATTSSATTASTPLSSPQSTEATSSASNTASSIETASVTPGQTMSEVSVAPGNGREPKTTNSIDDFCSNRTSTGAGSAVTATETGSFANRIALGGGHVALPLAALLPGLL
ncbi:hypothetical protein AYO22_01564 [Fonsecaea multimorphosa]|nr:hypothetical protein AYO22_01564 [Fonsecaea multimorphosa]